MKNYEKENSPAAGLRKILEEACEDTTYISETDAPFEPFFGGQAAKVNAEILRNITGITTDVPVEETDFAQFFERLTRKRDWHAESEKIALSKFKKLEKALKENLRDLRIFRFGRVRIDIYVVGIDTDGKMAGVKTKAVET